MVLPTDDPIYKTDLALVLLEILEDCPEFLTFFYPKRPRVLREPKDAFKSIKRHDRDEY